jgi:hypothetical protein
MTDTEFARNMKRLAITEAGLIAIPRRKAGLITIPHLLRFFGDRV